MTAMAGAKCHGERPMARPRGRLNPEVGHPAVPFAPVHRLIPSKALSSLRR